MCRGLLGDTDTNILVPEHPEVPEMLIHQRRQTSLSAEAGTLGRDTRETELEGAFSSSFFTVGKVMEKNWC